LIIRALAGEPAGVYSDTHVEIHCISASDYGSTGTTRELGGGSFLSDTSPEEKAAVLRALSTVHDKQAKRGIRAMHCFRIGNMQL
jgi:hypothetical protein